MAQVAHGGYGGQHNHRPTRLGGQAFNHAQSNNAEAEYDRLRGLARQEHDKRSQCFDKSHQAYERGDGAAAHNLSEEGKRHGSLMDQYNRQASEFIFRENNAPGRVDGDTIDLHGQFVEEAEHIVEERIRAAQSRGETHLHVIVGKGHHSIDHIDKLKPRVEQVCRELGLQYATEANEGRIYVNLKGGPADFSSGGGGGYGGGQQQHYGGGGYNQQHGGYQQHQSGYGAAQGQQYQNQNTQEQEIEQVVQKLLPRLLRKLCGGCSVM